MKLMLVILLTVGPFLLPARAVDADTGPSEFMKKLDDVRKAREALERAGAWEADSPSDLQKKGDDLKKALETLEGAERKRKEEFERFLKKWTEESEALRKTLHRPKAYQAVVDGVRYSMLLHIPGGAPESQVSENDSGNARPDSPRPSGAPLPGTGLKQPRFYFEPVR